MTRPSASYSTPPHAAASPQPCASGATRQLYPAGPGSIESAWSHVAPPSTLLRTTSEARSAVLLGPLKRTAPAAPAAPVVASEA